MHLSLYLDRTEKNGRRQEPEPERQKKKVNDHHAESICINDAGTVTRTCLKVHTIDISLCLLTIFAIRILILKKILIII